LPENVDRREAEKKYNEVPWLEYYAPIHCVDLAIHSAKIKKVKEWMVKALRDYRVQSEGREWKKRKVDKMLCLSGKVGCGKSALVKAVANDLDVEIVEWTT